MNRAMNLGVSVESITGHVAEGKSAVVRRYEGEKSLANKRKALEQISFDVAFVRPTLPNARLPIPG